jgi:hypothetical protein
MNKLCHFLVLAVLLNLAACATVDHGLSDAEIAVADAGTYPNNYEQLVKEWFANNLKEPDSAHYGCMTVPNKGYSYTTKDVAYSLFATVNAKNSYGGYAGWTRYHFTIKNSRVTNAFDTNSPPLIDWSKTEKICHPAR